MTDEELESFIGDLYSDLDGEEIQEVDAPPVDYSSQLDLANSLLSGQIFFLGLIAGLILIKSLWERFR